MTKALDAHVSGRHLIGATQLVQRPPGESIELRCLVVME
jgi:hypothetical protein